MKRLCYFLVLCTSFWWLEYASAVDWLGDVPVGETINFCFNTLDSAGEPVAIVETGISIEVYEDGGTTQITAGDTLSQAFDSVVGLHNVALVCTGANGYEAGKYYSVVIAASTSATADGVDIVGRVIGRFRCVEAENVAGTPAADITYVDGAAASTSIATAADIVDEWESQSQADPTGFHVNVMEWDSATTIVDNLTTAFASSTTEPTGVPSATAPIWTQIQYLYSFGFRNKKVADITSGTGELRYYDDGDAVEFEKDVTVSSGVTTETEAGAAD